MTPVWGARLSFFSRLVEVTGSVPEDFQARPVGHATASAFHAVNQRRKGLAR
jgi:hypothetical protein